MLTGYEIWDNRTDKPAGYATVKHAANGELVDIEVTHCTIPNSNPDFWVATAWRICNENGLAGVVFHHEASTVTISEITPF